MYERIGLGKACSHQQLRPFIPHSISTASRGSGKCDIAFMIENAKVRVKGGNNQEEICDFHDGIRFSLRMFKPGV